MILTKLSVWTILGRTEGGDKVQGSVDLRVRQVHLSRRPELLEYESGNAEGSRIHG